MSWFWPIAYAALVPIPILESAKTAIARPIIFLLLATALVLFLYGVYEIVANAGNEEARRQGQQHVFWGVIGLFIMVSFAGILNLVCQTINAC